MRHISVFALLASAAWAQTPAAPKPATPATAPAHVEREPGLYATIRTSMGTIVAKLYEKEAPLTVANFVALARGTKQWVDPRTHEKVRKPLYPGTIFHRVIPGFMIQGGDPLGNGSGDPGYNFKDEFSPDLKFDVPGRLAMANSGPNTNGSQFFITEVPTPHLNGKHTIFGQVVEGQELVTRIANVPRDADDKPRTRITILSITFQRYPAPHPATAVKKAAPATKSTAPAHK